MTLATAIAEFKTRKSRIDRALRDGTLTESDGAALTQSYAFVYKDGRVPVLGYSHSGGVQPIDSDDTIWCVVTTNEEDRDGDIIEPRGRMGNNYAKNPVWLFGHGDWDVPVGTAKDADGNIMVKVEDERVLQGCRFDLEDPDAHFLYGKIKRGFINATSIAFVPLAARRRTDYEKAQYTNNEIGPLGHHFTKWDHTETSWVPLPSNAGAIRDALDQEKSHISRRFQKALGSYAALSVNESGGCWGGWCPAFRGSTMKKKAMGPTPQNMPEDAGVTYPTVGSQWDNFGETWIVTRIDKKRREVACKEKDSHRAKTFHISEFGRTLRAKSMKKKVAPKKPIAKSGDCGCHKKSVKKSDKLSEFVRRVGGTLNEQPIFTALDTYESGKKLAQSQGGTQVRSTVGIDGSPIETWRLSFPEGDVLLTYGQYGKNKPWKMQINRAKSHKSLDDNSDVVEAALTDVPVGTWVTYAGEDGQVVAVTSGHARVKFRDGTLEEVPVGKLQRKSVKRKALPEPVVWVVEYSPNNEMGTTRKIEVTAISEQEARNAAAAKVGGKIVGLNRKSHKRKSGLAESSGVTGGYLVENELVDGEEKSGIDVEYDQGYTAAYDGRARNTNPYRNDTDPKGIEMKTDWDEGWTVGAKERLAGKKSVKKSTETTFEELNNGDKFTLVTGKTDIWWQVTSWPNAVSIAGSSSGDKRSFSPKERVVKKSMRKKAIPADMSEDTMDENGAIIDKEETYTPKSSAVEAAKAYSKLKDLKDYFGDGGEGDLATMDHPGMAKAMKELCDRHLPKAMEHIKSAVYANHADEKDEDADALIEKICKAIGGEGVVVEDDDSADATFEDLQTMEDKDVADGNLETGEDNLVDRGYLPEEKDEQDVSEEMGDEYTEENTESTDIEPIEDDAVNAMTDDNVGTDTDNDEILERYDTDKGYKTIRRKVKKGFDQWLEAAYDKLDSATVAAADAILDAGGATATKIRSMFSSGKSPEQAAQEIKPMTKKLRKNPMRKTNRRSVTKGIRVGKGSDGWWVIEDVNGTPKKVAGPFTTEAVARHTMLEYGAGQEQTRALEDEETKDALDVGNVDDSPNDAIIKEEVADSATLMDEMASDPAIPKRYKSILKHRAQRLKEMSDDMEEKGPAFEPGFSAVPGFNVGDSVYDRAGPNDVGRIIRNEHNMITVKFPASGEITYRKEDLPDLVKKSQRRKSAPGSNIEYRTPFGTFDTWEQAAARCEQNDMDPNSVIEVINNAKSMETDSDEMKDYTTEEETQEKDVDDMLEDKDLTDEGHVEYDGGAGAPLTEEGHVEYDGGAGSDLDNEGNPAELKRQKSEVKKGRTYQASWKDLVKLIGRPNAQEILDYVEAGRTVSDNDSSGKKILITPLPQPDLPTGTPAETRAWLDSLKFKIEEKSLTIAQRSPGFTKALNDRLRKLQLLSGQNLN